MECLVYAGIVTFNPNVERLMLNIGAIKPQVDEVIVIDNASKNQEEIASLCKNEKVHFVLNETNMGISYALNQMFVFAKENGAQWCITLDQDSISPSDLVKTASLFLNNESVGQIVPQILEHNTKETPSLGTKSNGKEFQEVNKSITSAAITNVTVWEKIGGFDDRLFIDYVDFDYAIRLKLNGFKIIRMNQVYLDHELGESTYKSFLGLKVRVANHSSFRKFYICRNIVIYIRRYHKHISVLAELLRLAKTIALVLLFEVNKLEKLKACMRGIKQGLAFALQ